MTSPRSEPATQSHDQIGLLSAIVAYMLWGLLPIYFRLLEHVPVVEVIAHRIIWSVIFLLIILASRRLLGELWTTLRTPRLILPLALTAVLIASNWMLYIWAVTNHHILAASIGYFLNPLVTVLLGFAFAGERLTPVQWGALAIAAIGVVILAAGALSTLWISAGLTLTFSVYGLLRKKVETAALVGLTAETIVLFLPALFGIIWWAGHGTLVFAHQRASTDLLLALAGVVTAIPLLLFAIAARNLKLSTLGLLQYITPTLQMLLGLFVYGEHVSTAHKIAFPLIWLALLVYSWSAYQSVRSARVTRAA